MPFWIFDTTGAVNQWLQSLITDPRWLLPVTFAGEELFYLVLIPFVYYTLDRKAGVGLLGGLLLCHIANGLFKLMFFQPRPFWVTVLPAFAFEDSFGLPSGHSQNAVVVWGYLAAYLIQQKYVSKRLGVFLGVLLIFSIGFSRLVLGVHFIQDVLSGWILGSILLLLILKYEEPFQRFLAERSHWQRSVVVAVVAVLSIEVAALLTGSGYVDGLSEWTSNARLSLALVSKSKAEFKELDPLNLKAFYNAAGYLLGMYAALSLKQPNYQMPLLFRNRLLVLLPGLLLIGIVYVALAVIFPKQGIEGILLRVLRYGLVVFSGLYIYPAIVARFQERRAA